MRNVAVNRRAKRDYEIIETYEAGIELKGTEVKSLRAGKVSLQGGYAKVVDGELFLYDVHIAPYEAGSFMNHDPKRPRRLLMHKREIKRLMGLSSRPGYTLIPLRIYFNDRGWAKVELALARGRSKIDKRELIKREEEERRLREAMKYRR
ncbi:SsrA-binding protein [Candidatus Poribacteria bacterium]|nr:MAG: SsrA-binding protein [Candidatus Poribacteria bacterium]